MNETQQDSVALLEHVTEDDAGLPNHLHAVERPSVRRPVTAESSPPTLVVVDDEPINLKVVRTYLARAGYDHVVVTHEALKAVALITEKKPDLVLLDIMMPEVSGLDILARLREDPAFAHLPVIILTASTDRRIKQQALDLGATDFLLKPVDPSDLVPRVRNALLVKAHHDHLEGYAAALEREVRKRTAEVTASRLEVIHCLGRAAEHRDNDTGRHVVRVGRYVEIIARELGLDEATVELLGHASPLHDVGKIGIPDAILLKPDRLTPDEFEVIQTHCQLGRKIIKPISGDDWNTVRAHPDIGRQILAAASSPILRMAASIALTHHERWDGTGYPLALAGEDIPLEGRITAVADVYDALSSKRPYKPAFPQEKCFAIMAEQRGRHFDPTVFDAFYARAKEITAVQIEHADVD